jgi:protein-L-isoaspartate(D-aspartate) O-methyltransferase
MNDGPELARLMAVRGIRDERVLAALATVPRELFVPEQLRRHAYADRALPIGSGQTISQPFMVATMLEALGLDGGRALEVGTGSGYQAALLAELADEVVTIERVPELAEEARQTLERAGYGRRVDVRVGDGTLGVPERAPFDGIVVAAAAPAVPDTLYEQLAPGGRVVVPVGTRRDQWLEIVERSPDGPVRWRTVPCRFVPLLGSAGFDEPEGG